MSVYCHVTVALCILYYLDEYSNRYSECVRTQTLLRRVGHCTVDRMVMLLGSFTSELDA